MRTITDRLLRGLQCLVLTGLPFAVLNCSDGDENGSPSTSSTTGDSTSVTSGAGTPSTSSTTSTGATEPTTSATSGTGGAPPSTGEGGSGGDASTSASGTGGDSTGDGGSGAAPTAEFTLTSPNHEEGAKFADKYTCAANGFRGSIMPALNWTPGPAGTKSYAITFIDTTLSAQGNALGYHSVIYNIPANVTSLPEGFKAAEAAMIGAKQNDNFLGPCPNFGSPPPSGSETHTYEFTLYALDSESVTITGSGTTAVQNAEELLEKNHLAKTKLTGTSNAANTR